MPPLSVGLFLVHLALPRLLVRGREIVLVPPAVLLYRYPIARN